MSKCDYCNNESRVRLTDENGTVHELCYECHNQKMADLLEADNFKDFIRKYRTTDIDGVEHEFEINKEIFFKGIKWTAYEINNGEYEGYSFELYTEFEDDAHESIQKLYNKIQKSLSAKYIKKEFFNGQELLSLISDNLIGRIEYDEEHENIPRIIIDGKSYTWSQV